MKQSALYISITLLVITLFYGIILGGDLGLPSHLEIIERDSTTITILDKNTGLVETVVCEGEPKFGPGWELEPGMTTDITDSCFYFHEIGWFPHMGYLLFGDSDRDSLSEVVGKWGIYTFIYENTGIDGAYVKVDSLRRVSGMDYYKDTDGDGKYEFMTSSLEGMRLFESPNQFSLPLNEVYMFPWSLGAPRLMPGGFTDLNGDGITEISFSPNYMAIYMLNNIGDNDYELAHHISHPDSLLDNYYDYAWGDFDNDGKTEVVTCGSYGYILAYEYSEVDSFEFVWSDQVYRNNCNEIVGPTDMDNDGLKEFIVRSESHAMGGFYYFFYESVGDNQFELIDVDSLPGDVWTGGSFILTDFDNNGIDELVVTTPFIIAFYSATDDNTIELIHQIDLSPSLVYSGDTNFNGVDELIRLGTIYDSSSIMEYSSGLNQPGDNNGDCNINGLDVVYLVYYFKGYGNELPLNIYIADVNGSCVVNGLDITYFVSYMKGGPELLDGDCR